MNRPREIKVYFCLYSYLLLYPLVVLLIVKGVIKMKKVILYNIYTNKAYLFKSASVVQRLMGVSSSIVYKVLNKNNNYNVLNRKYTVISEPDYTLDLLVQRLSSIKESHASKSFMVFNKITGKTKVYQTLRQASRDLGLDYSNMAKALKGELKIAGYAFSYVDSIIIPNKLPKYAVYKEGMAL